MKKTFWLFAVLFFLAVTVAIYFIFFFRFFPVEKKLQASIYVSEKSLRVEVYSVDTGTTSNYSLQAISVRDSGETEILQNYKGYNRVKQIELINDNRIRIVATGNGLFQSADTIYVKVN